MLIKREKLRNMMDDTIVKEKRERKINVKN